MDNAVNITKEKLKVYVKMSDGQRLLGFFFAETGERLQDILNDSRAFLPLYALGDNGKYQLVMLSKGFVQQVEEVNDLPDTHSPADRRDGTDRRTHHEPRPAVTPKFELD